MNKLQAAEQGIALKATNHRKVMPQQPVANIINRYDVAAVVYFFLLKLLFFNLIFNLKFKNSNFSCNMFFFQLLFQKKFLALV